MSKERIVAITGAAGALGGALAAHLAAQGYRVALLDTPRGKDRLLALAEALGGAGRASVHLGDLATPAGWSAAVADLEAALGGAPTHAALIAGGWQGGAPLHATGDDDVLGAMIQKNLETAYHALRALLPAMVSARHGSVVVVGSRAVERPWTSAGAAAYAATKSAVVTLAEVVAAEVLEHGVRVNAVLPSTMDTPANRAAMPDADPSRWVSLPSAAGVIAFLLSDDARDVSGAALPLYGRA
jgi:NAD(P)-dependent dehydrogenase (short-subunit alcohol dehydrogenase family)